MRNVLLTVALGACICLAAHGDGMTEKEVPPIPEPSFEDAKLGEEYARGVELLNAEGYKEAEKVFKRLRRSAPEGPPREGVERCYLEAKGGLLIDKIRTQVQKEQWKKALAACEKARDEYEETHAGEKLDKIYQLCIDELYFVIQDFEKDRERGDEGDGPDDRGRGRSSFGMNTKVVEGSRKKGTVRGGDKALEWLTGRNLSYISLENLPEDLAEGYRSLNLSIRTRDPKRAPQIRILFDCEEGGLGWGDGRGGRGGRRGGGRVMTRVGYHSSIATKGQWQDLRLDLRKFTSSGDAAWQDVIALRLVHMPGGDGRITIDNVRLEKK